MILGGFVFCILLILFLSSNLIGKYYVREKYILTSITDNKKIRIRGNYINIICDDANIRIDKENENEWYYKINNDQKILLEDGQLIDVGKNKFLISKKEVNGGFFVLLPIIISVITIVVLFLQNYPSMMEDKGSIDEYDRNNFGDYQSPIEDENGVLDYTTNDEMVNEENINHEILEEETQSIEALEDIHSIVLEYNEMFDNNIVIDWNCYQEFERLRRSLQDIPSEQGITVSKYQEEINWANVRADGIDFAIIQVGSRGYETGVLREDTHFEENISNALENNIKVGVCFYSQAITQEEIDEEIAMILQSINGYTLEYPIGITLEREQQFRTSILSDEEYIELIKYFCIRVMQSGYTPMIIGNTEWFQQFDESTFNGYLKMVYSPNIAPIDIDNCVIWQYRQNSRGMVEGIDSNLVLSISISAYIQKNHDND